MPRKKIVESSSESSSSEKMITKKKVPIKESCIGKYTIIEELGRGKDGKTYLVKKGPKEYAMKVYRKNKPVNTIKTEVNMQKEAHERDISPKIIETNLEDKYIVMERLDDNLLTILTKQKGKLRVNQEKQIIQIFKTLDNMGIFHGDSSVLNILEKDKKLYIIDFGYAKYIDEKLVKKVETSTPNLKYMPLGLLIQLKKIYPESTFPNIERYVEQKALNNFKNKK